MINIDEEPLNDGWIHSMRQPDISKGGVGSGIKGHKTEKKLGSFFGSKDNYEKFESQGGLEVLDKMFEVFGQNRTKDVLGKTTLSFDDEKIQSDAAGEVMFSSSGNASLRLRDKTALFGITHKQKKYILAHEIGHIAFTNFQLGDSTPLKDSMSEGLAILYSNLLMSSGWENNEYKKHAIQTFNLLKDFSEQEGNTVRRTFLTISNFFIDESRIDENINKFLKFAKEAEIKPFYIRCGKR